MALSEQWFLLERFTDINASTTKFSLLLCVCRAQFFQASVPRVSKEGGVWSGVEVSALLRVLPVLSLLPSQLPLLPASLHMSTGQRRDPTVRTMDPIIRV